MKSKGKRKTVVQVIQPNQTGGSAPEAKRSTSDIYFDYILGKK